MAGQQLAQEPPNPQQSETPFEFFASICTVLVVGLFIITFVFQNFEIPSSSMEKTLSDWRPRSGGQDHLRTADPLGALHSLPNIRRGDIIVFYKPGEPKLFLVKRVVAIPGDRTSSGARHRVSQRQTAEHALSQHLPSDDGNPNDEYYPYRDDFPAVPPPPDSEVTATW